MDSIIIICLILLALAIKFLFIDAMRYNNLRLSHSKTYIKKHWNGFLNRIFYKDYIREFSIICVILNYLTLMIIFVLLVMFFISLFPAVDVTLPIKIVLLIYLALTAISSIYDLFRILFLGIDVKGNKTSKLERCITIFALLAGIILLICNFSKN